MKLFHYEYYEQVELSITMFLLQYSFILTAFSSEVAFTLFNYLYVTKFRRAVCVEFTQFLAVNCSRIVKAVYYLKA